MLELNPNLKAVFFDLDDTLCDYMNAAVSGRKQAFELIREKLAEHTVDAIDEAYRKVFWKMVEESKHGGAWREHYLKDGSLTRNETMRRLVASLGIEDETLGERISSRYHELRRSGLRLYEDTLPVLEFLKPRYTLGLITNGPADIQRDEILALGFEHYFDHIFIEGEFMLGKPDPAIFRAALEAAQAAPDEMIFVGNSLESDIAGAKAAGIPAIWINREGEARKEGQVEPDMEIKNLRELAELLNLPQSQR